MLCRNNGQHFCSVFKMCNVSGAPSCCSTKYSYNGSTGQLTGLYILALVDSRAEQVTEWGCGDACMYVRWGGYMCCISIYNICMSVGWVTRHTGYTVLCSQSGSRHLVSIMDRGRAALHYLLLLLRVREKWFYVFFFHIATINNFLQFLRLLRGRSHFIT